MFIYIYSPNKPLAPTSNIHKSNYSAPRQSQETEQASSRSCSCQPCLCPPIKLLTARPRASSPEIQLLVWPSSPSLRDSPCLHSGPDVDAIISPHLNPKDPGKRRERVWFFINMIRTFSSPDIFHKQRPAWKKNIFRSWNMEELLYLWASLMSCQIFSHIWKPDFFLHPLMILQIDGSEGEITLSLLLFSF